MPPAPFDPCKQWLGIDAVDLVDPRQVLGIAAQETDANTVRRAAQARLERLHAVQPGPFEVARNALVKRVAEARDAVLAELAAPPPAGSPGVARLSMPPPPGNATAPRQRAAAPAVPRVPPVPTVPRPAAPAMPIADVGGFDSAPTPVIEVRRPVVYRKKSSGGGVLLFLIAGLAAAAGGLYWYKFRPERAAAKRPATDVAMAGERRPEPKPAATPRGPEKPPTPPEPEPTPQPQSEPTPEPVPEPAPQPEPTPEPKPMPRPTPEPTPEPQPPAEPAPEPERPAPTEDPKKIEASLRRVAESLRAADFLAATAAAKEAAAAAQTKASRERVERWTELVTFAEGFADYRTQALDSVTPGVEFDIDDKKIIVVEIDDEKFIYRFAGKNRTTPRNRIPGGILMAIVTGWFDDKPANDLFIGAYHATKEEPDLDKARASWERAAARGADASPLLPLLDDPLLTAAP
ncbi:MAG: hypothetical protein ACKOEM_10435 [Planctomycetia bacterium]